MSDGKLQKVIDHSAEVNAKLPAIEQLAKVIYTSFSRAKTQPLNNRLVNYNSPWNNWLYWKN
jgi:hypothetical protein